VDAADASGASPSRLTQTSRRHTLRRRQVGRQPEALLPRLIERADYRYEAHLAHIKEAEKKQKRGRQP